MQRASGPWSDHKLIVSMCDMYEQTTITHNNINIFSPKNSTVCVMATLGAVMSGCSLHLATQLYPELT